MILTFYDREFKALQDNASLNVGDWSLKRQAVDLDDFSATSEAFVEDINPTFVVMKTDVGRYKYGAFAGIPELTSENKTEIQASDLKTIHKQDVVLKFGNYQKLQPMFSYMLSAFYDQCVKDTYPIEYDITDLQDIDMGDLVPEQGYEKYSLWDDLLVPYMKFYDLFMDSKIDLQNKKIIFRIARINKYKKPLRLYENDIKNYGKWIANVNEAQCVVECNGNLTYGDAFILTSENAITKDMSKRDIFPIKRSVVFKQTEESSNIAEQLTKGLEEVLTQLINSMYNESVEINAVKTNFEDDYFDTSYDVYVKKGQLYKCLPLGSILENSKSEKKLTIGYKQSDVIVYL